MPPSWLSTGLLRFRRPGPRVERTLLLVAAAAMAVAAYFAVRDADVGWDQLRWMPLLLAAGLGVPLTLATNAAEFTLSARFVGRRFRAGAAIRTTLLATAANLLPLPGGALVRVHALVTAGVALRGASATTLLMGAGWIGTAASLAAGGAWMAGAYSYAIAALGSVGALGLVAAGTLAWRLVGRTGHPVVRLGLVLAVETVSVLIGGARIWLVLVGLGVDAGFGVALLFALAGVLANVVGLVPAGFGVREALSAGLALLVALPASVGFLVSLVDRVVGLLVAIPATVATSILTTPGGDGGEGAQRRQRRGQVES